MSQMKLSLISILLLLLLAACTAATTPEQQAAPDATATAQATATPQPTATSTATPTSERDGEAPVEADPDEEYPAAAVQARMALASQLNVDVADVAILSFERREWNNACLGLAEPDEVCAEVLTPGWLVMLQVDGQRYEVHTDVSGQQVRVAADNRSRQPAGADDAAVILRREGGIAGQVSEWRLYPSGQVEIMASASARDGSATQVEVDPARIDTLVNQIEERGFFDLQSNYLPAEACCDRFTYTLTVTADGRTHSVRAIEGSDDTPEAVWQSITLVQEVLDDATNGQEPER